MGVATFLKPGVERVNGIHSVGISFLPWSQMKLLVLNACPETRSALELQGEHLRPAHWEVGHYRPLV